MSLNSGSEEQISGNSLQTTICLPAYLCQAQILKFLFSQVHFLQKKTTIIIEKLNCFWILMTKQATVFQFERKINPFPEGLPKCQQYTVLTTEVTERDYAVQKLLADGSKQIAWICALRLFFRQLLPYVTVSGRVPIKHPFSNKRKQHVQTYLLVLSNLNCWQTYSHHMIHDMSLYKETVTHCSQNKSCVPGRFSPYNPCLLS